MLSISRKVWTSVRQATKSPKSHQKATSSMNVLAYSPSVNGFLFLTIAKEPSKLTKFQSTCWVHTQSWCRVAGTLHSSSWQAFFLLSPAGYFDANVAWRVSKCRFILDRFINWILSLHIRNTTEPALSTKANSSVHSCWNVQYYSCFFF